MTTIQERAAPHLRNGGAVHSVPSVREHHYPDLAALLREALVEIERLHMAMGQAHDYSLDGQEKVARALLRSHLDKPSASAFTGRRTARDRADIPTDAGVPRREAEMREIYEQECGGTIEPSGTSRIDLIGRNGPTGDHYRAIGQPPSQGDAQDGGE